jgi:putative DNA primase/helicase
VHHVCATVRQEAARHRDDTTLAKAYAAFVRRIESAAGRDGVLAQAKALPTFSTRKRGVRFDADPWSLNTESGEVDLRTGELGPHRRESYNTKILQTGYDPNAKCPNFERFLTQIFDGDTDLIDYALWAMGYTATGTTDHDCFFVLHGEGSNGKSTLTRVLLEVLGPYAQQLDPEAVLTQRFARHSCELAQLDGARLALAQETGDGRKLNLPLIKGLTGGDKLRARHLYRESFEFAPKIKLWLSTNARPQIDDDSHGAWRRVRLLPFNRRFEGVDCDPGLEQKLLTERAGVLALLVRQAVRVHQQGEPTLPEAVRAAVADYRAECDDVVEFLEEHTVRNADIQVLKGALHKAYSAAGGTRSQREFSRRLLSMGFREGRKPHDGRATWLGLGLRGES